MKLLGLSRAKLGVGGLHGHPVLHIQEVMSVRQRKTSLVTSGIVGLCLHFFFFVGGWAARQRVSECSLSHSVFIQF